MALAIKHSCLRLGSPKHEHLAHKADEGSAIPVPPQVLPEPFLQATEERLPCRWQEPPATARPLSSREAESRHALL